jgi:hypothetical protein
MTGLLLKDAVMTILSQGTEDGTIGGPVGTAVTVCVDRIRIMQSREVVDASCQQDDFPVNRVTKLGWEMTVEMKLEKGGTFAASLQTNSLVSFEITASGYNVEGAGIVTQIEATFDNPSTLSITIAPYGSGLTVTAS